MLRTTTTLAVMILAVVASVASARQDGEATRLGKETAERWLAAYNGHDPEAVVATYAEDADLISMVGDQVALRVRGRDALRGLFAQDFSESPDLGAKVETDSARFLTPDVIVVDGAWELLGSSTARPTRGRYTVILKKNDGQWRIVCHRVFAPQPAAADQSR